MQKNIDYYNNHAELFYDRTRWSNVSKNYLRFLKWVPENGHILDAGCGVGRDSAYFLAKNYKVTAFDGSPEMVKLASQETGLKVIPLLFQEMEFFEEFDAIWAQASLLHISYDETPLVFLKMHRALKEQGIFFGSYKYGHEVMITTDRDFYNMDEIRISTYFKDLFEILELWTEPDLRSVIAPSPHKKWLNFIARKI